MATRKLNIKATIDNKQAKKGLKDTNKSMKDLGKAGNESAKKINKSFSDASKSMKKLNKQSNTTSKTITTGTKNMTKGMRRYSREVNHANKEVKKLQSSMKRTNRMSVNVSHGGGGGGGGGGIGGIGTLAAAGALGGMAQARSADVKHHLFQTGQYRAAYESAASSMSSFSKNLIAIGVAAAAATATIIVLKKVLDFGRQGASIRDLEAGFTNYTASLGANSKKILADLTAVSAGTIAQSDLMRAAGNAMLLGIPAQKLAGLMKVARASMVITGQTTTEAFNDITLAVGRGSKMILDNLGIIVDVEKAYASYADELGVTKDQLTDIDKKQAFLNETMKKGNDIIEKLGHIKRHLDVYDQLSATLKDTGDTLLKHLGDVLEPYAKKLGEILKNYNAIQRAKLHFDGMEDVATLGTVDVIDYQLRKVREGIKEVEDEYAGLKNKLKPETFEYNFGGDYHKKMDPKKEQERKLLSRRADVVSIDQYKANADAEMAAANEKKRTDAIAEVNRTASEEARKTKEAAQIAENANMTSLYVEWEEGEFKRREIAGDAQIAQQEAISKGLLEKEEIKLEKSITLWQEYVDSILPLMEQIDQIAAYSIQEFAYGFSDAFVEFTSGALSAKEAFRDFAADFLKHVAKMITEALILLAIQSALGFATSGTGSATGNPAHTGNLSGGMKKIALPSATPKMASGGIVTSPTLAMIGEGGESEAVIPLSKLDRMIGGNSGVFNSVVNVTVNGGGGGGGAGGDMTKEQATNLGMQVDKIVTEKITEQLVKQKRVGGLLNKSNMRTN